MSTSSGKHLAMLERRLQYLADQRAVNPMAQAEQAALRWALPLLREQAAKEAPRQHMGEACRACNTPGGFLCAHLPRRT